MRCIVGPPADNGAIAEIEKRLGAPLPESLRQVIAQYSSSVDIAWQLREGDKAPLPPEFRGIFAGEIRWDLAELPDLIAEHAEWVSTCFNDPDDSYNAVWHNKFPIMHVGTGDMIGIETGRSHTGAVVFLSHDDGEGHGYILGTNFEDYIDRLSRIGGVGAEDWQWVRFTSSKTSGLEPDWPLSKRWRTWFGLTST
jgi:cell wall assembly regulator SMI1